MILFLSWESQDFKQWGQKVGDGIGNNRTGQISRVRWWCHPMPCGLIEVLLLKGRKGFLHHEVCFNRLSLPKHWTATGYSPVVWRKPNHWQILPLLWIVLGCFWNRKNKLRNLCLMMLTAQTKWQMLMPKHKKPRMGTELKDPYLPAGL